MPSISLADRVSRFAVSACGVLLVGHFLLYFAAGAAGRDLPVWYADGIFIPFALVFTVLGIRVSRDRRMAARARPAWWFITGAYACQLIAHTAWFIEDALLHRDTYPSVADYWFLIFIPFMVTGLLLLPGATGGRGDRVKLALDALIVGAGSFMVLWYLVLSPILAAGAPGSEIFYSAALPVGDLLLVLALVTVLLRGSGPATDGAVRVLAGAVGLFVVADIYYAYIQLHAGFVGGTWPDLLWLAGCYVFVVAAHRQHERPGERRAPARTRHRMVTWLPYIAIALAYALLAHIARPQGLHPLGGMITGAVLLTALVVARQMVALRENRDLAVTDSLTGLVNRSLLTERLGQLTRQPLRPGRHAAVLLIDLDRFKPINDTYGHEAGDAVLQAVAATLTSVLRDGDTAGRLGGDEFAVVLPNLPGETAAESIAARLVEDLRTPVIFGDHVLEVRASIGVAVRDPGCPDGETLLQHADTAMYAAKRTGRARYVVYSAELDTRAREAELRRAIAAGELVVHYQPIIDLTAGCPIGFEALVRWQHPDRGLLMPGDFIDLAEETGAVVPLGEAVLRTACRQVAGWAADIPAARGMRLSVNLSPKQVVQADLPEVVARVLADTGFPPELLVLELTEGVMLEPDPAVVRRLDRVRAMGVGIAVDDFGTGYSALSYLRTLPVNILKIDRSFVIGIESDPAARTVAEAVVRLGEAFAMTVVAEGVETAGQAAALGEMGCPLAQGFHFHRPLPAPDAEELLRATVAG